MFQEKKSVRPTFSAEHIYGGTLLAMCSNDFICFYDWAECRLIRRIDVNVKVSTYIILIISWHYYCCMRCSFVQGVYSFLVTNLLFF